MATEKIKTDPIKTKHYNLALPGEEQTFYKLIKDEENSKKYGFHLLKEETVGDLSIADFKYSDTKFTVRKGLRVGVIKGKKRDLISLVSITGTSESDIEKVKQRLVEAADAFELEEVNF